jgi:hypothetical protein
VKDIFYDIETKELLDQNAPDEFAAIRAQHLTVGATWCECHDQKTFHRPAPLTEHLLSHDRIIGFNIIRFDNTVLAWSTDNAARKPGDSPKAGLKIPREPRALKRLLDAKSFDIEQDLESRLGHRVSLGAVAEGTLGKEKLGSGPRAVVWNRIAITLRDQLSFALADVGDNEGAQRIAELGTWFQERLEQYCMADVMLVKKLFEHGTKKHEVTFIDFESERRVIKVQWR